MYRSIASCTSEVKSNAADVRQADAVLPERTLPVRCARGEGQLRYQVKRVADAGVFGRSVQAFLCRIQCLRCNRIYTGCRGSNIAGQAQPRNLFDQFIPLACFWNCAQPGMSHGRLQNAQNCLPVFSRCE